jgi:HAD superfamily hydrolase (TIGR01549 family)
VKWQAVFFDFDGVILDSVDIKTKAFAKMFCSYGTKVEREVVSYHLKHEGISRFKKFRYFYENILKKEITEEKLEHLGEMFTNLVLEGVLESPFVEGVLETLEQLHTLGIPAYIVSGTPHEEINYIVKEKGLSHFFKAVHGSPRQKGEIIKNILNNNGYQRASCLFIGDAMSDYNASQESGVCFLGIVKGEPSLFPDGTLVSFTVTVEVSLNRSKLLPKIEE